MTIIYIQNPIPTISASNPFTAHLQKQYKAHIFSWNLTTPAKVVLTIESLQSQLVSFLKQHKQQSVCLILDGFASFIYFPLADQFPNVKQIIICNPIFKNIIWKKSNLKNVLLPTSMTATIYKYMYLFKTLSAMHSNQAWLACIRSEQAMIDQQELVLHKLFDQLLKMKLLNQHHVWLCQTPNLHFITGSHNPLVTVKYLNSLQLTSQITIISQSGYCIAWEQTEQLVNAVSKSLK